MIWKLRTRIPDLLWVGLIVAAAVALAVLPLTTAAVLFGAAATAVLALIRPHYALYGLAFAIPFGSVREIQVGPVALGGAEAFGLLVAGAWALRVLALREPVQWRAPLTWALALLLFVGLVSTLGALSLSHSAKEMLRWGELLVVFLAAGNLLTGRQAGIAVGCLLAGAALEGLLGAYQFFRQAGPEGFILFGRYMRAFGSFEQPNPYAGYLGLLLPLGIALPLAWFRDWRKAIQGAWTRAAAWIGTVTAAGLALAGIVMSWSRGAWIGVLGSGATVVALRGKKWATALLAAAILLALLAGGSAANLLPASILERFADIGAYFRPFDVRTVEVNDANWALVERMAHWQAGWAMFSDRPWLGVGFGNYEAVYPAYAVGIWRDPLGHAHNYYVNIAAEAGLAGLAAYLIVVAAAFVQTGRALARSSGLQRALCAGAIGMLVHLSIHNMVDNLYVHGMNMLVGMVLGIAWAGGEIGD